VSDAVLFAVCTCRAMARDWRDHACTCPFARYAARRELRGRQRRQATWTITFSGLVILAVIVAGQLLH
jgi:hypothetical protein